MDLVLLTAIVVLLLVLAFAVRARRRASMRRQAADERHRLRRRELELGQEQDPGFHSWRTEEFAYEHEAKRAGAEKAARAADVYAHLAEEQEVRAAELAEESADAATRAGLEDVRARLEADPDAPAAGDR